MEIYFLIVPLKGENLCTLNISFKTTEIELLKYLLRRYIMKRIGTIFPAVSRDLKVYGAMNGDSSLTLKIPENKIILNIFNLYKFLLKEKLPINLQKFTEKGDYSKLIKNIKKFDVTLMGKCNTFLRKVNDHHPRLNTMLQLMNDLESNDREAFINKSVNPKAFVKLENFNNLELLYLSIILEGIPCNLSRNEINFMFPQDLEKFKSIFLFKDSFKTKIASFFKQFGLIRSGASSDAKLEGLNTMINIYGLTHNFDVPKINSSSLIQINYEIIGKIKKIKF
jgi:hypothetical protein